jgi:hypothetical protein
MQSSIWWCKHQRNILTHPKQSEKIFPAQEHTYPERKRNASGGDDLVVGKTEARVPGTFGSVLGRTEVRSADKDVKQKRCVKSAKATTSKHPENKHVTLYSVSQGKEKVCLPQNNM